MKKVIASLLLLSGCYFHAVDQETTRTRREVGDVIVAAADRPAITMTMTAREVRVKVEEPTECIQPVVLITETTREKTAALGGIDGGSADGSELVIAVFIVVEVAILLLSGLVTAIEVGADDGETWESGRETLPSVAKDCSVSVGVVGVELVLPSGRVLTGETDAQGEAVFAVPAGEAAGAATVRSGELLARAEYFPDRASCLEARDRRFAADPTNYRALPRCEAETDGQETIERAWELARDCEGEAEVQRLAPTLHARLTREGAFAGCESVGSD